MTDARLVLAIPSKGRLMEAAEDYFAEAGFRLERRGGSRRYLGSLAGIEGVDVRFLSAGEIASGLLAGDIDLGITGRDLLHEKWATPDEKVAPLAALGFGQADVVVAVPEAWLDVETMGDLAEVAAEIRVETGSLMRVATKFSNMTRTFFADHGIADYRIVESLGATEGAPAAGTAELIVDITSTGATLTANHLKILEDGVILRSEAFLCASLGAGWSKPKEELLARILDRLAARERARRYRELRLERETVKPEVLASLSERFDFEEAMGKAASGEQELVLHVRDQEVHEIVTALKAEGADVLTVRDLDFIFTAANPLYQLFQIERGKSAS